MSEMKRFSDDPRLTAYALGELDEAERAEVEALLRENADARGVVEEVRAAARRIEEALKGEAELWRNEPAAPIDPYPVNQHKRVLSFPRFYYLIGGLAAACFAIVVAWHQPELRKREAARKQEQLREEQAFAAELGKRREAAERQARQLGLEEHRIAMPAPEPSETSGKNEVVVLSPFNVESPPDIGYFVATTVAGSRLAPTGDEWAKISSGARGASAESYAYRADSDFTRVRENPLSTFSADVDTASYANVRRMILAGQRPPIDAVRIEEMVNYFPYRYEAPKADGRAGEAVVPFAATMEVAAAPWRPEHRLVRIGLKGREVTTAERGAANLVFLLDVSGSMNQPHKLPLVKESMRLLLGRLRPDDRVAIVTYAGSSGLALPSTKVEKAREIEAALDELSASGSTNGGLGIQLAYDIAKANFVEGGVNRVILCTDGDFNVGTTSEGELVRLVEEKAKTGVFLTALGFGMGNLKDSLLQQIADRGNGGYGYIDTRREAEKLLVEQVNGTLVTIAKDVKLQVEFNPAKVAAYRLIGYEKRLLKKEDFNNDAVDAGEIGAGHTVTALYEIVPVGVASDVATAPAVDERRYQRTGVVDELHAPATDRELLTLKVRYKEPAGDESRMLEFPLVDRGNDFAEASDDFKFAAAVAGLGMLLRDSPHKGSATFAAVAGWAESGLGADAGGYRAEFVDLVRRAESLR